MIYLQVIEFRLPVRLAVPSFNALSCITLRDHSVISANFFHRSFGYEKKIACSELVEEACPEFIEGELRSRHFVGTLTTNFNPHFKTTSKYY